jgi:hypothetical protein
MKKYFELGINISNIKHLLNLDKTIAIIGNPGPEIYDILDISNAANQSSLKILKDYMYKYQGRILEDHIERIYFGQETCENLIPTVKDVEQALDYCKNNELGFTFTTPYVGPEGAENLYRIFEYLNSLGQAIEVVFNDYGVLYQIDTKFANLKPVMGRLLVKMKRDPRFSLSGFDIASGELKNVKKVQENQHEVLIGSSLEIPSYQKFLREKRIDRACIDTISQGIDSKILKRWDLSIDLYWPWTYITSHRNCAIAAYTQVGKDTHPTDEPCKYQCKLYEFTFKSDKKMLPSVQRGNAVWMNSESLYKEFFEAGFERLIYQPYIPV